MDWHNIDGWFTDADAEAYRTIIESLPARGGTVVEIGSWMGRSIGALIEQCRKQGKLPRIISVDTFKGSDNDPRESSAAKARGGSVH